MKKIIKATMGAILVMVIFYLGGCFANASFDISNWSETQRSFIAMFMTCGAVMVFIAIYQEQST